ncbi:hypothetical protein QBC39DRAFT_139437 [Podospora conica]|nr:hypothetical protein QBC39DRAFT_139437 [Schizothecium conicum]
MPSMDQGPPDTKRARTTGPSWPVGLLHPTPSPTSTTPAPLPHHPPTTHYQPPPPHHPAPLPHPSHPPHPPHTYSRQPGPGDPHPPPSLPPHPQHPSQQQQQQHPLHPPHPPPHDDRRHHEAERYPPMQEQRPPHSPVHPPYPGYPPRGDPSVKPDPGDDTLPQLRRPLSTGNAHDSMTPGTPHAAHPPPPPPHSHYPDDKRHLSFDNGPPPHMYRQPSYPPPTPLPHQSSYDYAPSYGTPHGETLFPLHITAAGKRKAQRASQACDSCRQLKAKCDELKPCKSCKEKKVECKYREAVPKQQDKMAADILDHLFSLRSEFRHFDRRMNQLESALKRVVPSVEVQPLPPVDHGDHDRAGSVESPRPMVDDAYSSSPGETLTATQAPIDITEARNITRNMEEEMEAEPGPHVRPGVPAIPLNHTTLAALLLKWQSIETLVRRYLEAENVKFVEEFPIRQEERRGLLRVWGRGEGFDSARLDRESLHDFGMMEVSDDYSDAGAPSPADCWGGISGSPGPGDGKLPINPPLDFTESTVWKYVKSYQDNIQNMHPLIIPVELNAMVKLFLDSVHTSNKRAKLSYTGETTVAKFAYSLPPMAAPPGEVGSKRKRSSPERDDSPSVTKLARPTFQRSINNALVLLVLALGKICLQKDKKIPDVVPVSEPSHGSPLVRNGYPASPTQGSPPAFPPHSHSSGLPSPKENAERSGPSRRPSFQGGAPPMKSGYSHKRNLDVIPGLDYFAYATDILGAQLAGTSLRHIHAHILAGLYHGQLGRVMESYAYIKEAGWALQIKLRPSLDRFRKLNENLPSNLNAVTEKSDNQLVFAFWTCLQLESDIIAELPLPQSHILAFEEIMPYPNLELAKQLGFDSYILSSYVAQLYLRKSLNQIHQMLYNPENPRIQDGIINHLQNYLDMRFVPPEFKFSDNDPPAKDILAARLRAKYWGAQVITYRPFIRQILESSHRGLPIASPLPVSGSGNSQFPGGGGGGDPATPTTMGPIDSRSSQEHSEEVVQNAVKGIRALIESTRAFHGVEDRRFIITNVFGTAHAQWGNLLTLAAAFRNPILTHYIDEHVLRDLFVKTIAFFRLISQPSSALSIDMRILEGLERELWGRNKASADPMDGVVQQQQHHGSSFSSTASGPTPGETTGMGGGMGGMGERLPPIQGHR